MQVEGKAPTPEIKRLFEGREAVGQKEVSPEAFNVPSTAEQEPTQVMAEADMASPKRSGLATEAGPRAAQNAAAEINPKDLLLNIINHGTAPDGRMLSDYETTQALSELAQSGKN